MPKPTIGRRAQIAAAAVKAGHLVDVQRESKRFRIVCDCGWQTNLNWTRKHVMDAATDHMIRAGRTALGETPTLGEIPPVTTAQDHGVSLPGSVGADL